MAEGFDHIIVEGPSTSRYLYEFADEYIVNDIKPNTSDGYKGTSTTQPVYAEGVTVFKPVWGNMGRPELRLLEKEYNPHPDKKWRCLAPDDPAEVAEILCAFRPVKRFRGRVHSDKEYLKKLCVSLVGELLVQGFTIGCIGGPDNYHIPGTIDLRGKSLERQCSAIAGAKVVLGPSSGPMHLASLCKTPHVVWYNRPDQTSSYARYRDHWNPFNTPHVYLRQQVPTPIEITEAVVKLKEQSYG